MSKITWTNISVRLGDLKPWARNPRQITKDQARRLAESFDEFGQVETIAVSPTLEVYNGHQRLAVLMQQHGADYQVEARQSSRALSEKEREKLTVYLHKGAAGQWDFDTLANEFEFDELVEWGFDEKELLGLDFGGGDPVEDAGAQIDRAGELREKWGVETGQLWQLGEHRLICGDCTDRAVVKRLMGSDLARMVFTDPPYGIGQKIENDNLKREDLTEFYLAFSSVMLDFVMVNAYVYVWGYFNTLSDYWQEVIKPRGDCNFRNFIIWKKKHVQGVNSEEFRQFPETYEAALLYIFGQPFQNGPWSTSPNADYYPEIFEPIRAYLDGERQKMGWDLPTVKKLVGHSDLSGDHWFGKFQWSMPTREVYEKLQAAAKNDAFRRDYDELRRDYDELRGYFDNTNGFTDIWEFAKETRDDRHPTTKPVELCERGILSTSQDGEIVLDVFLGSGTTLIACERLGRKCRAVEIEPRYVAVTLERYQQTTGDMPVLITGKPNDRQ